MPGGKQKSTCTTCVQDRSEKLQKKDFFPPVHFLATNNLLVGFNFLGWKLEGETIGRFSDVPQVSAKAGGHSLLCFVCLSVVGEYIKREGHIEGSVMGCHQKGTK